MRHQNLGRKFDRDSSSRKAMFKNLVANLFAHGRIETTVPKAKEVRRIAERMITKVTRLGGDINAADLEGVRAARRLAVKRDLAKFLPRNAERIVDGEPERLDVVEHLFREVAPRFVGRPGGYTRVIKTRNRRGDNAEMAILTLVGVGPAAKTAKAEDQSETAATVTEAVRTSSPKTE